MEHVIKGVHLEYRKLGRLCLEAEFGPYFHLVRSAERAVRAGVDVIVAQGGEAGGRRPTRRPRLTSSSRCLRTAANHLLGADRRS